MCITSIKGSFFTKSLIYLTHHNDEGAIGIVLNYKIMNVSGDDLFEKLNIVSKKKKKLLPSHRRAP